MGPRIREDRRGRPRGTGLRGARMGPRIREDKRGDGPRLDVSLATWGGFS